MRGGSGHGPVKSPLGPSRDSPVPLNSVPGHHQRRAPGARLRDRGSSCGRVCSGPSGTLMALEGLRGGGSGPWGWLSRGSRGVRSVTATIHLVILWGSGGSTEDYEGVGVHCPPPPPGSDTEALCQPPPPPPGRPWPAAKAVALLRVDSTRSIETGTVRGLRWHNRPRERKGKEWGEADGHYGLWRERPRGKAKEVEREG